MKKVHHLFAAAAAAALVFGCSGVGSGGGGSADNEPPATPAYETVEEGKIGELPEALLAAAELAERLDAAGEDVILFYYRADKDYSKWGVYLWNDNVKPVADVSNTVFTAASGTDIGYVNLSKAAVADDAKASIAAGELLNFIVKQLATWDGQSADLEMDLTSGKKHFMVMEGDNDVYIVEKDMKPSISLAQMETKTTMKVVLSVKLGLSQSAGSNGFSVKSSDGSSIAVKDVQNYNDRVNRDNNYTATLFVTLDGEMDFSKVWFLSHSAFAPADGREIATGNAVKIALSTYEYGGDDLGLTLNAGGTATFKVWAPTADKVSLLLYWTSADVGSFKADGTNGDAVGTLESKSLAGTIAETVSMEVDKDSGIWSAKDVAVGSNKYYKYQITSAGKTYYVCDMYAKAASADSIAAQIADINSDASAIPAGWETSYTNPFGKSGTETKTYSDAVIYEMHIRDWSRAVASDSTGKFLDIANSAEILGHIKDLGVTHVQILPMFDYAQTNENKNYNWGYNPYHYNVPEGRYVTDGYTDGTQAVKEMRQMIQAFHDAGIAVNMDVVYNHTSGTLGWSMYDSTVPYYFYRLNSDGTYSNGSGCGNEVDSGAPMMKKYIIDSLKHWMEDYHINGFRFDLMGLHEKETMQEIYKELSAIDKNVMVYGEPWTGGTAAVVDGCKGAVAVSGAAGSNGVGAFNDDFRDAIKGADAFNFYNGQIQGTYNDEEIRFGLKGNSGGNNRNPTGKLGFALHYVECHDNYTLFDKLVFSALIDAGTTGILNADNNFSSKFRTPTSDELELIKKQEKLAAAYVFLSQGTPFINGGQEFLRTKKGNPDSYSADMKGGVTWTDTPGQYNIDDCNTIDLERAKTYADVYNTYKGLIALRKDNLDAFGKNTGASASSPEKGVTMYTAGSFRVFFNAKDEEYAIPQDNASGYTKFVDVSSGTPTESTTVPASVQAKSFVILKKQ